MIKCFTTAKANAFENLLEPLQKLLRLSPPIALSLAHPELFQRIHQKLQSNKAVVRLNLLRIVRSICDASEEQGALISRYGLEDTIHRLSEHDGAVLVRNMASELIRSNKMSDKVGINSGRRRPARRSSSSATPPGLLHSYSLPSTPTSSRSAHASQYLFDSDTRHKGGVNGNLLYRPPSRDRTSTSKLPTMVNGPSVRSKVQLPPTTSTKALQRQVVVSPRRDENAAPRSYRADVEVLSTPSSRRRRQVSGEMQ